MLATTLDVERREVETELLSWLLEEVVLHLGAHRVVEGLGDLERKGDECILQGKLWTRNLADLIFRAKGCN